MLYNVVVETKIRTEVQIVAENMREAEDTIRDAYAGKKDVLLNGNIVSTSVEAYPLRKKA